MFALSTKLSTLSYCVHVFKIQSFAATQAETPASETVLGLSDVVTVMSKAAVSFSTSTAGHYNICRPGQF